MSTSNATDSIYDAVVVGAGPAGIMAAYEAGKSGRVLLIESSSLPRDKSCGGMLNEHSQEFLSRIAAVPDDLVLDPRWVNFRYVDWDRSIRKATELRFLNVDRRGFDEWLLSLLPDTVTVAAGTQLLGFEERAGGVDVSLRDGEDKSVTCGALIGADGARSSVRRGLGVSSVSTYVTLQDFCVVEGDLEPYFDCIYMRDVGDCFAYGYVVPKGPTAIVGSVFYPKTKRPHEKQNHFLEEMRRSLPLGDSVRREAWAALSVRTPGDVVPGRGRVLLAGEAGGWMSPTSGEGISYALNTGAAAGRAVATCGGEGALAAFTMATDHVRQNIVRKLKWLPFMESSAGKYVAGFVPAPLVSRVTRGL